MKKFVFLTPCLMIDSNRKVNNEALDKLLEMFPDIPHVIYAQEYKVDDYRKDSRVIYIGNAPKREGFIKPRNELLKWFYASDYDYAIWIDATDRYSKPSTNDAYTILNYLNKEDSPIIPRIYPSVGAYVSQVRIDDKKRDDYFERSCIYRNKSATVENAGTGWMMANFKKHFGVELFIDSDEVYKLSSNVGYGEDQYLYALITQTFGKPFVAPSVCLNESYGFASTWLASEKGNIQEYPKFHPSDYIEAAARHPVSATCHDLPDVISIPRVEQFKELLKPYKPRKKKVEILDGLF